MRPHIRAHSRACRLQRRVGAGTLGALAVGLLAAIGGAHAQVTADVPAGNPVAIVDLASDDGARLVDATWRYSDASVVEVDHRGPGPDLRASGAPVRSHDIAPHAGAADFDDSAWPIVPASSLDARRGNGRLSFGWYRTTLTIPARIGTLDPTGTTAVFEVVVDDYAEVWVDGRLPVVLGQAGGQLVKGFNAPNRVVIARGARIERLATGFQFIEGPVWHPDGYLLFSDPNANVIYRWTPDGQVSVFRAKSGYAGVDVGEYHQPGSNGLTLDAQGRLTIDEHGRRRVVRQERTGAITVLADRYEGKRLNSPNDLVYKSDGALYVTDPPFGLPKVFADPRKELPFSGVYRVADGKVQLLTTELTGPNGLAFSPDERFLYVDDWDVTRKVIMRYPVNADGSLGAGTVFVDATASHPGEQAWDGLKVDRQGNVYAAGPGGVWILSPDGKHLGTIAPPEAPANLAWGDDDGRTLYVAARTSLYRIRLNVPGIRPWPVQQTSRTTP